MKTLTLKSTDGSTFHVTVWDEVDSPKAVLQFAHGMTEYSARYDDVAAFYNDAGYIFIGSDHRGHGYTAQNGKLGITEGDAFGGTIEDMASLTRYCKKTYGLPVVLYGHSYGSFLTQGYIQKYASLIQAVILSGSTFMGTPKIKLGAFLSTLRQMLFLGKKPDNFMIKQTFTKYAQSLPKEEGASSWLTRDASQRSSFRADKMTGYPMCVNFYASFLRGISKAYIKKNMENIPKNLPLLLLSGDKDPAGNDGKDVKKLYNNYVNSGLINVRLKLYENARHKLLSETNKAEVIEDMIAFFDEITGNKKLIKMPYDKSHLTLEIVNPKAVLTGKMHGLIPDKTPQEIITDALKNPIDSLPLHKLAEGKRVITIITSDHTRAVPSKITLPIILAELRRGNPQADIRIIIATGLHRATTVAEQRAMFGDEIVDNEKILINDANDPSQFTDLGELPSGASCQVNKLAVDCDLLISEGFIEPHFFAGFSGGRKSVLPGISSKDSINENHCFKAIANPLSTTGVLQDNPIHKDMLAAAEKAKLAFILNVALNSKKQVLAAFAGEMHSAHAKGVEYVTACSVCDIVTGDIVITGNGGYPLDQNLYQTPKAMATAALCAKPGGVIIMCAACIDGVGGENFERIMLSGDPAQTESYLSKIPPKETIPEMWNAQVLLRILLQHKVILVSNMSGEIIRKMNMIPAENLVEALSLAKNLKGENAEIVVIPDGVTVLCKK